ncbi:cell wall metabolism sensor histidine kinase WalK [Adlercreutzia sp. ZJ473]|uniref:sensor histidine kinase n=1 Tax=Adlercreutzia sp. ZJ473 TaxID=2722822 RepID=UPI0020A68E33|nr:HAMP domain-containing sensor histidine kinase [Adlercreutzia sp. ZJ473]
MTERVMVSDAEPKSSDGAAASATTGSIARVEAKKRFRWSSFSYTTRVTLAFAFIAAMTALVAIGVVSFVWEQHFQTYTTDNMRTMATTTAERIASVYERTGDLWNPDTTKPALQTAELTSGVGVKVIDAEGGVPFDSSASVRSDAPGAQKSFEPTDPSQVAMAPIVVDNVAVGSVRIWVYGSDTLMRQPDQEFRNNSYQALLLATVVAIILASCIGFLFARNLVAPINRMTKTARAIKEGDLAARTNLHGEDEIARLGETFDAMAESVEKDRELERRLTTDVAHELRTPLMAIQATVEAMVDGVYEADEERLVTVNSEVQRLSRLVDALLKLSRLENRSQPMKEEVVDVGELIEGIVSTHEMFVADSGLTIDYQAQRGVRVVGDPDMIRQATANLVSNAVRYTPEGGHIHVRVRRGDIMASISVEDTGIGLTREEAKMVFSRFWRADAGRTRESGGLGVGLAVVKEIVDRHGGWVQVEGEKGKGACFTIHIPLYDAERAKKQATAQARSAQRNAGRAGNRAGKKQKGRGAR